MTGGPRKFFSDWIATLCHVCKLKSKPLKTVSRGVIRQVLKVEGEECLVFRFSGVIRSTAIVQGGSSYFFQEQTHSPPISNSRCNARAFFLVYT